MKPMPASVERMNNAATMRSAFFARGRSDGTAGSSRRAGGEPFGSPLPSPSRARASAGGGVPITRCGPAASGSSSGALGSLIGGLPVLRSYPHRAQHPQEQQAEEREQAPGHRPDAAEAEAPGGDLGPGRGGGRGD